MNRFLSRNFLTCSYFYVFALFFCGMGIYVYASSEVPVAVSVSLTDIDSPQIGTVVGYDEERDSYFVSIASADYTPFGVVSDRPVLILDNDSDLGSSVSVVVQGVTYIRVINTSGSISRGDVLRLSDTHGVAQKADIEDDDVVAIALEEVSSDGQVESLVLADVGVAKARAIQENKRAELEESLADDIESVGRTTGEIVATTARIVLAMAIAGVSLAFLLYTFRSIWVNGVTAVGRNPRAQKSVLLMSIGSSILLILLAGFMVIVALAVLVVGV